MSETAATAIAMLAALAAAASFGVAAALQPVSAVLLGTLLFGERLADSPMGITVQVAGAAAAIAGITLLGRYAGTPGPRTAASQAGPVTGPAGRCAQRRAAT